MIDALLAAAGSLLIVGLIRLNVWYWSLPPEERELDQDDYW